MPPPPPAWGVGGGGAARREHRRRRAHVSIAEEVHARARARYAPARGAGGGAVRAAGRAAGREEPPAQEEGGGLSTVRRHSDKRGTSGACARHAPRERAIATDSERGEGSCGSREGPPALHGHQYYGDTTMTPHEH